MCHAFLSIVNVFPSFQVMNGRFFAGQQLLADFWDGVTNFATGVEAVMKEEDEVCIAMLLQVL
jgi:hypothetical protein